MAAAFQPAQPSITAGTLACNGRTVTKPLFYDKPITRVGRLLEIYFTIPSRGFRSFIASTPICVTKKLFLKTLINNGLQELAGRKDNEPPATLFNEQHRTHAVSAFDSQWNIDFPHSPAFLYSAIIYYTGFEVDSGEYKGAGLAPCG